MSKKVLVVDDSVFMLGEMKHIIMDTDFEIVGYARSGEEAIAMYGETKPDVVTLDIILPGIDGLDTARLILEQWPDANIIMVSSLAYDETMKQAKEIGARDFIFKPFEKQQMLDVLTRATEKISA